MTTIPVRDLVHIHADRRSVFQMLTTFGEDAPGIEESSRVLSQEGARSLVEFYTRKCGVVGGCGIYRTVEWVTPHEPERIEFETAEDPLPMTRERYILEEQGGCTVLHYESKFRSRGWLAGWLIGVLVARPALKKSMREHLEGVTLAIEARATGTMEAATCG